MTRFINLIALLFAVAAALFYCSISNAAFNLPTYYFGLNPRLGLEQISFDLSITCTNQSIILNDKCDIYVITD
jgi:hypothetical protein